MEFKYLANPNIERIKKLDQLALFRQCFGFTPVLYVKICSFLRHDETPSCSFDYNDRGLLRFTDWSREKRYDIVQCYAEVHQINCYYIALQLLELDIKTNNFNVPKHKSILKKKPKDITQYQFTKREFSLKDSQYWSSYGISIDTLKQDGVVPIASYTVHKDKQVKEVIMPNIAYLYTEFADRRWKLYRPLADRKSKWLSKTVLKDIGNTINGIAVKDVLVITKSYKDCKVIESPMEYNTVWLQSEVAILPKERGLLNCIYRTEIIYIIYDNDDTGLKNSEKLKDNIELNFDDVKVINYRIRQDANDLAELYQKFGKEEIDKIKNIIKMKIS